MGVLVRAYLRCIDSVLTATANRAVCTENRVRIPSANAAVRSLGIVKMTSINNGVVAASNIAFPTADGAVAFGFTGCTSKVSTQISRPGRW